jgi:WW domain binding protein 11
MVKKKGGREMNPADAFRKAQRAKEIARNKKERKFLRDASSLRHDPEAIKKELQEVIRLEDEGKMNTTTRLKKRAFQQALTTTVTKQKVILTHERLSPASFAVVCASATT